MKGQAVGVIGLGIMGSAISARLARAGFAVYGYDVLEARRRLLKRAGGFALASCSAVFSKAPAVITSLPSAQALHAVAKQAGRKDVIVIETSTLPIEDKLAARDELRRRRLTLLDCPLSGTGAQARSGDLSVYASGDASAYRKIVPILEAFARSHHYLGEFGNGSRMKYVANLLVAIHNVSAAEAFVLGMKAGLDAGTILKVVGDGAGASRMFQVRGPQMVAGNYADATMKIEMWQKDMKIIAEFAAALGVPTPLFNASAAIYNAALAQGFAQQDTASVCAVLERMGGLRRRT